VRCIIEQKLTLTRISLSLFTSQLATRLQMCLHHFSFAKNKLEILIKFFRCPNIFLSARNVYAQSEAFAPQSFHFLTNVKRKNLFQISREKFPHVTQIFPTINQRFFRYFYKCFGVFHGHWGVFRLFFATDLIHFRSAQLPVRNSIVASSEFH
jgi:hypothetical protein